MKNILILSASPRKNGNSDILCRQFIKGAREAGHKTELISLYDKNIECCRACYACFKTGKCVIRDDMAEILDKMQKADVIVVATPTYFYTMNGKMKTVIDRFLPKWRERKQCRKPIRRAEGRDIEQRGGGGRTASSVRIMESGNSRLFLRKRIR